MPYDPIHHSYATLQHFITVNKARYTIMPSSEIMTCPYDMIQITKYVVLLSLWNSIEYWTIRDCHFIGFGRALAHTPTHTQTQACLPPPAPPFPAESASTR